MEHLLLEVRVWGNRLLAVAAAFGISHVVHTVNDELTAQTGPSYLPKTLPLTAALPLAFALPSVT
jgi:hypothetical protein